MPMITSTMNSASATEADAEPRRQDQETDQRDEGGQHEDVAVGEVDHADDAEDHRVADGDRRRPAAQL